MFKVGDTVLCVGEPSKEFLDEHRSSSYIPQPDEAGRVDYIDASKNVAIVKIPVFDYPPRERFTWWPFNLLAPADFIRQMDHRIKLLELRVHELEYPGDD